jgi:hypothetical protein
MIRFAPAFASRLTMQFRKSLRMRSQTSNHQKDVLSVKATKSSS